VALVFCGLAGFFLAQFVKTLSPTLVPQWFKLTLALLGSAGAAALIFGERHHGIDLVVYADAGAGLAVIAHKLYRLMSTAGDWLIQEIIRKRLGG
jgi:hypothetical protein